MLLPPFITQERMGARKADPILLKISQFDKRPLYNVQLVPVALCTFRILLPFCINIIKGLPGPNPKGSHISNIRKLKANFCGRENKVTFIVKTFLEL